MNFGTIFLIGVGVSMDAFAVSLSNGMTLKKINLEAILKFGLYFGVFQALMPTIGFYLGGLFSTYITSVDHWVAFILLSILGGKLLYESLKTEGGETCCGNPKRVLCFQNMIILSIATSVDAMAVGVIFTGTTTNIFIPATIIGITTMFFSSLGVAIGNKISGKFNKYAETFGGMILIFIGIKILVEHILA